MLIAYFIVFLVENYAVLPIIPFLWAYCSTIFCFWKHFTFDNDVDKLFSHLFFSGDIIEIKLRKGDLLRPLLSWISYSSTNFLLSKLMLISLLSRECKTVLRIVLSSLKISWSMTFIKLKLFSFYFLLFLLLSILLSINFFFLLLLFLCFRFVELPLRAEFIAIFC